MKRFFLSCLVFSLLLACGPIQDASSTVALGNAEPMSVACATGFTRTLPHYCANNWSGSTPFQSTVLDNTCRSNTWAFVPTSATRVRLSITDTVKSTAAIGLRTIAYGSYSDSSCVSTAGEGTQLSVYEHVAVVAGTQLAGITDIVEQALIATVSYYKATNISAHSTSSINITVIGYYD